MTDTIWTDCAYFQAGYDDTYPYRFACFRANDNDFVDPKAAGNLAWAKRRTASGHLVGYLVYTVVRFPTADTLATLKRVVGTPTKETAIMLDVESWNGAIKGDHSKELNALREEVINWLNSARQTRFRKLYKRRDRKRVLGYANQYDRASIWPSYGDTKWIIANYSINPKLKDQIGHQFTSTGNVPPFGRPVDVNSADGISPSAWASKIGIRGIIKPPAPKPPVWPLKRGHFGPGGFTGAGRDTAHQADIKVLQKRLVAMGYAGKVDPVKWCDGIYGKETVTAVNAAKKHLHWLLGRSNGQVGSKFWTRLFKAK